MVGLSISPHKEFRFLLSVLPLCTGIAGLGAYVLMPRFPLLVKGLLFANLPMAWYLGRCHQRGPIDVMDYLSDRLQQDILKHTWIDFLVPCHATPYYSYLHQPHNQTLHLSMLDCSPAARLSQEGCETDRFMSSPLAFVTSHRYPKGPADDLPHYIVVFDSAVTALSSTFLEWGYQKEASFFYSSIKSDVDAPTLENDLHVYSRRRK